MATYLITGGAGFIGSHVSESLYQDGHRIINIDNFSELYDYKMKVRNLCNVLGLPRQLADSCRREDLVELPSRMNNPNYRLEVIDIRDYEAMDQVFASEPIDAVIHLAALPGVRASLENPFAFEEVNCKGTLVILELMRRYGVKKWLCASSSSVYGSGNQAPYSESDVTASPISYYASTKLYAEQAGYTYHHLFHIDTIMLRFFTVYGERQRPDLAIHKFTRLIDQGEALPFYGDGTTTRDYTYIHDIVDGVRRALTYVMSHENVYEIFNLGGNDSISLGYLVWILEQELGKNALLEMLPQQPGDMEQTGANIDKARHMLGYEPKTTFREGIQAFIRWYKGEPHDGHIRCRTDL